MPRDVYCSSSCQCVSYRLVYINMLRRLFYTDAEHGRPVA